MTGVQTCALPIFLALRHKFVKLSREDLNEAEDLLDDMEKDPETAFFLGDTHKKFHASFYDGADRKLGKDILQNIYGNLTRLWVDFIRKKPSLARGYEEESRRQHHDLLRAAKSQDLGAAEAVLTQHINHARDLLVSHLRLDLDRAPEPAVPTPTAKTTRRPGQRRVRGR